LVYIIISLVTLMGLILATMSIKEPNVKRYIAITAIVLNSISMLITIYIWVLQSNYLSSTL
jgi:hypothetical protein